MIKPSRHAIPVVVLLLLIILCTFSYFQINQKEWILPFTFGDTRAIVRDDNDDQSSSSSDADISSTFSSSSACKWNTTMNASWTNNTEEENDLFWKVQACHRRMYKLRIETWNVSERPPPSSLRCGDNIMNEFVDSILSLYDNIIFMGDSIIRQQFFTMICMIEPSLQFHNITLPANSAEGEAGPRAAHPEMRVLYKGDNNTTDNISIIYYAQVNEVHRGQKFLELTTTTGGGNSRDALILNLGAHYNPVHLGMLQKAAEGVHQRAQETNTSLFYMETVPFEWPTSNGEFIKRCYECRCEALTPERIRGDGNFTGPARYRESNLRREHELPPSVLEGFKPLYPDFFAEANRFSNDTDCIPFCLPANWRNDVTNSILSKPPGRNSISTSTSTSNGKNGALTIVPIWKQLVSSGYAQHRTRGDCTHKSTDALIAMNQQLLRSMKDRAYEFLGKKQQ